MSAPDFSASFGHDLLIVLDTHALDATSRTSSPYFSDVVTLAHRDAVGVYGLALDHTDWAPGTDVSTVDVDGYFTVTALPDATLTLTLPSNYTNRLQVEVPAQTAPVGVPDAYITRRANAFAPDEDPEAVYCWLGWRYLRVYLDVPEACTVTAIITYQDLGTHGDNHYSDSTRQTEYTYSPGAQHTLTREVQMAAGTAQPMLIDLAGDTPLAIVTTIKLTLGAVGGWRLAEPQLMLDPGDGDRDPVTPHWCWKFFEHYGYCEGGISAVVDGQRCAIEWPDHYKPNTLERHLGGNFDVITGKESGIDFTAAHPLSTVLGYIHNCADAWDTSYSTAAADAHLKDEDDNVLKTLSVTDLRPTDASNGEQSAPDIAVRVGKLICAPGLHYDLTAEKWVHGAVHGWMGDPTAPTRNGEGDLYRREYGDTGSWEHVEDLTADGHGYYRSQGHEVVYEYTDTGVTLYSYATGPDTVVGRFAVREWVSHYAEIETGVWVRVHTDPVTGVQWCAALRNGKLVAKHRTTGIAEWCADIVIADAGDYQTCDITGDGNLLIVLAITSDGTIDQFWTRTDGDTWDGPETI